MCSVGTTGHRFDIRLTGRVVEEEVAAALGCGAVTQHATRTVVRGRFDEHVTLHRLLREARAYGLEVVEIRQLREQSEPRTVERA